MNSMKNILIFVKFENGKSKFGWFCTILWVSSISSQNGRNYFFCNGKKHPYKKHANPGVNRIIIPDNINNFLNTSFIRLSTIK